MIVIITIIIVIVMITAITSFDENFQAAPWSSIGHNYIGHNYIGHNYTSFDENFQACALVVDSVRPGGVGWTFFFILWRNEGWQHGVAVCRPCSIYI